MNHSSDCKVIVGVTGASGSIYAESLVIKLLSLNCKVYLVFSAVAEQVVRTELEPDSLLASILSVKPLRRFEEAFSEAHIEAWGLNSQQLGGLSRFMHSDLYAPVASGSARATHMVVVPGSMGAVARMAHGISANLLERSADVMLKERRKLVVVPRETPLSTIHLSNLLQLAQAGAHIIPAMPAFYHRPKTIQDVVDFVVERVLDALDIPGSADLAKIRWNSARM